LRYHRRDAVLVPWRSYSSFKRQQKHDDGAAQLAPILVFDPFRLSSQHGERNLLGESRARSVVGARSCAWSYVGTTLVVRCFVMII